MMPVPHTGQAFPKMLSSAGRLSSLGASGVAAFLLARGLRGAAFFLGSSSPFLGVAAFFQRNFRAVISRNGYTAIAVVTQYAVNYFGDHLLQFS